MTEKILLETKDLCVNFGGLTAVNKVNILLPEGKIISIIGPNGAGKTTLFNLITGVAGAASGKILFRHEPVTPLRRGFAGNKKETSTPSESATVDLVGKNVDIIARMGLSRTFQNIRLYTRMTVLENIVTSIQRDPPYSIATAMLGLPEKHRRDRSDRERAMEYLKMLEISEYAEHMAVSLPYGKQRRLEIARAIATKPKLLLLDEPAAGMNNEECGELVSLISDIHKQLNITILLIEHHMDVVMRLSDEIYVINLGSVLRKGLPAEIQSDPEVIKAYLGEKRGRL